MNDEQANIDKSLNFLINYKPDKKVRTRGKSIKGQLEIPSIVSQDLIDITDINDLHAGVLLDYLKKVNIFNKKLLANINLLSSKYDQLLDKSIGKKW